MNNKSTIALLKLLLAGALFFAPILVVRSIAKQKKAAVQPTARTAIIPGNGKYFFIGSSRTRAAINDSLLNDHFNSDGFVNLGIDNGTFIFNNTLANKLMEQANTRLLFIELSVINARLPANYRLLADPNEIIDDLRPLMERAGIEDNRRIFVPLMERVTLSKTRLGPEISYLVEGVVNNNRVGYLPGKNRIKGEPSLVAYDLLQRPAGERIVHPLYSRLIRHLIDKAGSKGIRLVFVLPPAMKTNEEQEVLTAVYSNIPRENKLLYRLSFLDSLDAPLHFNDDIHLNTQGAEQFTNYLANQCEQYGWLR